jgi:hypothetical protein
MLAASHSPFLVIPHAKQGIATTSASWAIIAARTKLLVLTWSRPVFCCIASRPLVAIAHWLPLYDWAATTFPPTRSIDQGLSSPSCGECEQPKN